MNEIKVVNVPLDTSQPKDMTAYIEEKRIRLLACADAHAEFSKDRRYIDHPGGDEKCKWSF